MDFKKILNILIPQPKVGALEITDIDIKFAQIFNGELILYSAKLPAGAVSDGKIKNKGDFLDSLKKLHSQIVKRASKKINVILNIPDNNVYFQVFNLPALSGSELEEAANLNLKMISPIDFGAAYSDWQAIGKKEGPDGNQLEIAAGFAQSQIIDDYEELLKQAGFVLVAVEFSGLALAKLAVDLGANVDIQKPFILFFVGNNGLSFNLIINGSLYFNHFVSWQSAYAEKRQIPIELFKKLVVDEFKKVLSFYSSHWDGQINEISLVAYGLENDIIKTISENFTFKTQLLSLKKFREVMPGWFSVLGSALRGIIPRAEDTIISLAKIGTEEKFYIYQLVNFIRVWRNIIISLLTIFLAVFAMADIFLVKTSSLLNEQSAILAGSASSAPELQNLQNNINEINKKIDLIGRANREKTLLSGYLEKINNLKGNNISFTRIFIQSIDAPVFINAVAANEDAAVEFKNKLASEGAFNNIDLPITKIVPIKGGVEFTISFKIR